ncbi:MAG: acetyltransferase [Anaerolineae bacterium]
MNMTRVVIIGAGGFAREVLDVFEACNQDTPRYDVLGFIVDPQYGAPGTLVNDKPILGGFDRLRDLADHVKVICGVGAPEYRRRLVARARELGCHFCSVVHPSVIVTRWVEIGEGSVIAASCTLSNHVNIGAHVHINPACTIGHDTMFADFAALGPGVCVSGNVVLQEGCYVGTGASIIQRIEVGRWSVIGAGCTVIRNVLPNSTVVGVPGRVVKTRESGWHLHEQDEAH